MSNVSPGLMADIHFESKNLWKYQDKRGDELCNCCLLKNRKRINLASIEYGHGLSPLEYFRECLVPRRTNLSGGILRYPPRSGCDAWVPLWGKDIDRLNIIKKLKRHQHEKQLELWERES
jgi:hypothetical protein